MASGTDAIQVQTWLNCIVHPDFFPLVCSVCFAENRLKRLLRPERNIRRIVELEQKETLNSERLREQ
jgi:hypothetical protein